MRPSTLPAALLLCSLALLPTIHAQDTADYKSNPKFQSAMAEGKQLSRKQQCREDYIGAQVLTGHVVRAEAGQRRFVRSISAASATPLLYASQWLIAPRSLPELTAQR